MIWFQFQFIVLKLDSSQSRFSQILTYHLTRLNILKKFSGLFKIVTLKRRYSLFSRLLGEKVQYQSKWMLLKYTIPKHQKFEVGVFRFQKMAKSFLTLLLPILVARNTSKYRFLTIKNSQIEVWIIVLRLFTFRAL